MLVIFAKQFTLITLSYIVLARLKLVKCGMDEFEIFLTETNPLRASTASTYFCEYANREYTADPKTGLLPKSPRAQADVSAGKTSGCQKSMTFKKMYTEPTFVLGRVMESNDMFDTYSAFSNECLGNKYAIYTADTSKLKDYSYTAITNVNENKDILITVAFGNIPSGKISMIGGTKKSTTTFLVAPLKTMYIMSSKLSLRGFKLWSKDNFQVKAGNKKSKAHAVEMFPPISFFDTGYIVPHIGSLISSANWITIMSLSDFSVDFTIIECVKDGVSLLRNIMKYGQEERYSYKNTAIIRSNGKLLVTQYMYTSNYPTSMTLIPPEKRWAWKAVVYSLDVANSDVVNEYASVIFKYEDRKSMDFFNLNSGKYETVAVSKMLSSAYAQVILTIKNDGYWIQNRQKVPFQVIHYGVTKAKVVKFCHPSSYVVGGEKCAAPGGDSGLEEDSDEAEEDEEYSNMTAGPCNTMAAFAGPLSVSDIVLIVMIAILATIFLLALISCIVRECTKQTDYLYTQDEQAGEENSKPFDDAPDSQARSEAEEDEEVSVVSKSATSTSQR